MIDLFQRNFDTDSKGSVYGDASAAAEAIADLKSQLEAARQEGFDAGRTIGKQDAQAEFDAAETERLKLEREAIRAQIEALAASDTQLRLDTERDIVELFSGIAERLVPEILDTYGVDLAVARIRQSVQQSRTDPVLIVRACPDVIGVLQHEAPDWLSNASRNIKIDLQTDPSMNRGAAQVCWRGGRLNYDIHAASLAMLKGFAKAAEDYEKATQKAG